MGQNGDYLHYRFINVLIKRVPCKYTSRGPVSYYFQSFLSDHGQAAWVDQEHGNVDTTNIKQKTI